MTETARIALLLLVVAAIVGVMFVAGWADNRAKPGSVGRVPVATATPNPR
jgi:hypothetical protein